MSNGLRWKRATAAHVAAAGPAKRLVRRLLAICAVSALAACAHHAPPPAEPPVRTVAIIPVWQPDEVSIERVQPNSMLPLVVLAPGLVGLVDKLDMTDKRATFVARFGSARQTIGMELTSALVKAGAQRGFRTILLDDMPRSVTDPDDIEYEKLQTDADVIVHVRVNYIGVLSPRKVDQYLPKITLGVVLVSRRTGTELLNENFEYGAEATERAFWSVPSDARYAFPDFGDVMSHDALVEESWHVGAQALGTRVIEQIGRQQ